MRPDENRWIGAKLSSGRYTVTAKVGEGGMGVVYRARDTKLGNDVVIKALHRGVLLQDPDFARRFQREIQSLVHLSHPHVVKVFDAGEHAGVPYAVMQYLAGGNLEDRRPRSAEGRPRPVRPDQLGGWLEDLAKALDFIHSQGYVHRDVKPANVLFDQYGNVYLSDFGIAKTLLAGSGRGQSVSLTQTGMVLGTPEYMAPEVIMGAAYDGRADQYALAVVVHELLSGEPPFDAPTPAAVLVKQTRDMPPRLETLLPGTPQHVCDGVWKALSKSPADRFPKCVEFARAIVQAPQAVAQTGRSVRMTPPLSMPAGPASRAAVVLPPTAIVSDTQPGYPRPTYVASAAETARVSQVHVAPPDSLVPFAVLNFCFAGLCLVVLFLLGLGFLGALGETEDPEEAEAVLMGAMILSIPNLVGAAIFALAGVGLLMRRAWGYYFHMAGAALAALTCVGVVYTVFAVQFGLNPRVRGALLRRSHSQWAEATRVS